MYSYIFRYDAGVWIVEMHTIADPYQVVNLRFGQRQDAIRALSTVIRKDELDFVFSSGPVTYAGFPLYTQIGCGDLSF